MAMNIYMNKPQSINEYPLQGSVSKFTVELDTHVQNRFRCTNCGSHVANAPHAREKDPHWGFPVSVFCNKETGALPDGFPTPKAHTYYSTRLVDVHEELPKYPLFGSNSKAE
jgi:hypothetical protein